MLGCSHKRKNVFKRNWRPISLSIGGFEAELLPKLVQEHGASDLITKVRKLNKELGEAETALRKLGFSWDENRIEVHYDAPEALAEALEAAKRSARQERDKVLKRYDLAILSVWALDDAQEARKTVEDLL